VIFQNAELHNIQETLPAPDGEGWRLRRVTGALWEKLNPGAQLRSYSPAGAELRFNLLSDSARITLKYVEDRAPLAHGWPVIAEIHHGDFFARWIEVRENWTEVIITPPPNLAAMTMMTAGPKRQFDPALVRLVLPYLPEIRLKEISGEIAPPNPGQIPLRRYLAYGSSITNGAFAARPGETYPARVAREIGVDHFNLGFGAGAYLEPEMSAWIAGRDDWDLASFELGTNLVAKISVEDFAGRVDAFLGPIIARHRDKWIFVIDLFSPAADARGDPKPEAFRGAVRAALERLAAPRLVYVDGRRLLPDASGLISDLNHPSSDGTEAIAQRLGALMRGLF
jgi:hypothetical protein